MCSYVLCCTRFLRMYIHSVSRLDIGHHHSPTKMLRGSRKACSRQARQWQRAERCPAGVRHRDSDRGALVGDTSPPVHSTYSHHTSHHTSTNLACEPSPQRKLKKGWPAPREAGHAASKNLSVYPLALSYLLSVIDRRPRTVSGRG